MEKKINVVQRNVKLRDSGNSVEILYAVKYTCHKSTSRVSLQKSPKASGASFLGREAAERGRVNRAKDFFESLAEAACIGKHSLFSHFCIKEPIMVFEIFR